MSVLRLNDYGASVQRLQLLLSSYVSPSPQLRVDGQFGARTQQAVLAFQKSVGLSADGIVGPKTWAALGQKTIPAPVVPGPSGATSPWLEIAVAELGVHENSLPGKHNQRIIEYHKATSLKATSDETPWCSSFVNWVLKQSGRHGTNNALAKSWLDWGIAVTVPTPGVIVVIKKKVAGQDQSTGSSTGYHVAFFTSQTPNHIRLLGGNQGDQVKYSNFSLASYEVKGYRKPI